MQFYHFFCPPLHFGTLHTGYYNIHAYPDYVYIIFWGIVTYYLNTNRAWIIYLLHVYLMFSKDLQTSCLWRYRVGIQRLCSQLIDVHLQTWNTKIPLVPPVRKALPIHNEIGLFCYVQLWHFPEEKHPKINAIVFLNMFNSWAEIKLFQLWCYHGMSWFANSVVF